MLNCIHLSLGSVSIIVCLKENLALALEGKGPFYSSHFKYHKVGQVRTFYHTSALKFRAFVTKKKKLEEESVFMTHFQVSHPVADRKTRTDATSHTEKCINGFSDFTLTKYSLFIFHINSAGSQNNPLD